MVVGRRVEEVKLEGVEFHDSDCMTRGSTANSIRLAPIYTARQLDINIDRKM